MRGSVKGMSASFTLWVKKGPSPRAFLWCAYFEGIIRSIRKEGLSMAGFNVHLRSEWNILI